MKREWIRDFSEMPFTAEEYHVAEAVTWFTDSILCFNGKDFKLEDPSDTCYFTSKESLMENLNYTYNELEKQGVFDLAFTDEEEAPADPWLKVLEDRVALETEKELLHRQAITDTINRFKEWVNTAAEIDIYGDVEYKAKAITDAKYTYKAVWKRLCDAKAELEQYKKTMNL